MRIRSPRSFIVHLSVFLVLLVSGEKFLGSDSVKAQSQFTVSGVVTTSNGTPISGVTVTLVLSGTPQPNPAQTDNNGNFTVTVPAGSNFEVIPSKTGFTFTPISQGFSNVSSNLTLPTPFVGTQNSGASIQFTAATYSVAEVTGSIPEVDRAATIAVTRSGDLSGSASVNYATSDGTANQRTDYTTTSGTLTFGPGEATKSFQVLIIDDAYVDGTRTVNLNLSGAVGATLGAPSSAILNIGDNDTTPATSNPIDDATFFVRQHYYDFLSRVPDDGGLGYWSFQISSCGTNTLCIDSRRVGVSAAYFIELEFQDTGGFVYRFYKSSYGTRPTYAQFMPDRSRVVAGANLDAGKAAFADAWVQRPEFLQKYPAMSGPDFVNALLMTVQQGSGVDLSGQRNTLINEFNAHGRAGVVQMVAENSTFKAAEFNNAFVLMQYFGYLRRDPEEGGYLFWLNVLNNQQPNNFRGMVCAFLTSAEYQTRFSPVVTKSDQLCAAAVQ